MNKGYLLCIKKNACMEQAQKPRRRHGFQELLSGRSQTLSLMFNLLLCLRATKHSVFEMLSLLCHPCVSQALLFSPREIYYYYCFFMHLLCPGLNWLLEGYIVVPGRAFGWSIQQRFWTAADRRQLRAACLNVALLPGCFMLKVGIIPLRNTVQTSLLGSSLTCTISPEPAL